jgi:hypothetical protein
VHSSPGACFQPHHSSNLAWFLFWCNTNFVEDIFQGGGVQDPGQILWRSLSQNSARSHKAYARGLICFLKSNQDQFYPDIKTMVLDCSPQYKNFREAGLKSDKNIVLNATMIWKLSQYSPVFKMVDNKSVYILILVLKSRSQKLRTTTNQVNGLRISIWTILSRRAVITNLNVMSWYDDSCSVFLNHSMKLNPDSLPKQGINSDSRLVSGRTRLVKTSFKDCAERLDFA